MAATIKDVYAFFGKRKGETLKDFTAEWSALSDEEKAQIKNGIGDGSFTY